MQNSMPLAIFRSQREFFLRSSSNVGNFCFRSTVIVSTSIMNCYDVMNNNVVHIIISEFEDDEIVRF